MDEMIEKCCASKTVQYSIFDKLVFRSYTTKLKNYCHYKCSLSRNISHIKFNGRYPFREVLYCTEFASTIFSLLNLIVHIICYERYIKHKIDSCRLGHLYKYQYYIFCLCWVMSTLFHINDTVITRNGDYFAAFMFLLFALYLNITRCKSILGMKQSSTQGYYFLIYYIVHVLYMSFIDFDYTYSKIACSVLLLCSVALWIVQYILLRRNPWAKYIIIYSVLLIGGALFEVYDMPPIYYLFDSHAIWHLITALIAPFYYVYLENDIMHKSIVIV